MANEAEIERLREKLAAREGLPGMEANCKAIKERIAELEAE